MFDAILSRVDPATGHALGTFFQQLAAILLNNAAMAEEAQEANARRRRRMAEIRGSADAIEETIAAGATRDQAIELVAARLLVDPRQLAAHYKASQRRGARRRQITRNVEIMRLAGTGWDSARIGAKVGLSSDRVDRIIKRMIADGRDLESLGQRFRQLRPPQPSPANTDGANSDQDALAKSA